MGAKFTDVGLVYDYEFMPMKKMTCSQCVEKFELLPGKPGRSNVCPRCSVPSPEQRARQLADAERRHKSLVAAVQSNAHHHELERKSDLNLMRLGFERVPGSRTYPKLP
jgi:hypothetical protein